MLGLFMLNGCTSADWYDIVQHENKQQCLQQEALKAEDCMDNQNQMSYEEYEKAREDLSKH